MNQISVMLVDDDPFIREVVSAALGANPGVNARGYSSVAEALAGAHAAVPDIIVLDFTMPGTDGIAVARDLRRALSPMPPVVFLTARDDADLIARLRAEGAAGVLTKRSGPTAIAAEILRLGSAGRAAARPDTRLDEVAAKFRASLPQTVAEIDREWAVLKHEWRRNVAESLQMRVHKLAGSAGLFRLGDLGRAALVVDAALRAQLDGEALGGGREIAALERRVAELRAAATAAKAGAG